MSKKLVTISVSDNGNYEIVPDEKNVGLHFKETIGVKDLDLDAATLAVVSSAVNVVMVNMASSKEVSIAHLISHQIEAFANGVSNLMDVCEESGIELKDSNVARALLCQYKNDLISISLDDKGGIQIGVNPNVSSLSESSAVEFTAMDIMADAFTTLVNVAIDHGIDQREAMDHLIGAFSAALEHNVSGVEVQALSGEMPASGLPGRDRHNQMLS